MNVIFDLQVQEVPVQGYTPPKCYDLNSAAFNQSLYILGGTSIPAEEYKVPSNVLQVFNIHSRTWKVCEGKNKDALPSSPLSGQSCILVDNKLYVFGGSQNDGLCTSELLEFSFQKEMWNSVEKKGSWPQPREGAILTQFLDKYLILLGGVNVKEKKNYETYWVYSLARKEWIEGQSLQIPPRVKEATCFLKNKLYIYGGQWRESKEIQTRNIQYLSDLYQLEMKIATMAEQESVMLYLKKIQERDQCQYPKGRSGHKLVPTTKGKFLLIGGETEAKMKGKSFQTSNEIWLFDTVTEIWIPMISENNIPCLCQFAVENIGGEIYIFGGLSSYQNINANLYKMKINMENIEGKLQEQKHREWESCDLCYEIYKNKNQHMEPTFKLTKKMVSQLTENIYHPFSAFGLFCDNSLNYGASYLKIAYAMYDNQPLLIFEDDGKILLDNIQYQDVIVNFEGGINMNYNSVEKRSRGIISKEIIKKEYGANIKIGGLRLGTQILNISINANSEARIALFTFQEGEYVSYFYVYHTKNKKILDDYSEIVEEHINSKYGEIIKEFISRYNTETAGIKPIPHRNVVFCFNLRKTQKDQYELRPNQTFTDLLCVPGEEVYKKLTLQKSKLLKSIDISLQTYLIMLYLKNQHTKISLEVESSLPQFHPFKKFIINQQILDGVDDLIKDNSIYEIDGCLNFEFKIVELYLNPDLSKDLNIFQNGVLLYYRNRLIKRFGIQIGMILDEIEISAMQGKKKQFFNMFGVLQLPESLAVNFSKSDFVNHVMLEKFYSRLNFIGLWFKENFDASIKTKIAFPKRKLQEMVFELPERQAPSKRVKPNNDDDDDDEEYKEEDSE